MSVYIAEFLGTFILMLLGSGVVANVVLKDSKGEASGWIVITVGWGMAVFVAVYMVGPISGAHINPAVTFAMLLLKKISLTTALGYIGAQFLGAFAGSTCAWLAYRDHFSRTDDTGLIRAVFCTEPAIRNPNSNFISEMIATSVLILGVLFLTGPEVGLGSLDALPVGLLVLAIGLSLGGPTGYAINPARDLGPRIAHFLLPIKNKGGSDWSYSWIPVFGPLAGAAIAVLIFSLV